MSNVEFRNNLTEGTSVKGKKERTQYGALGDSERENYRLRETITYFNLYNVKIKQNRDRVTLDKICNSNSNNKKDECGNCVKIQIAPQ